MRRYVRVIINADDLGTSCAANDAIFELMALRRISSATIIANGATVADAVKRARNFPECSFGVHLNLTQFRPLTDVNGLGPLLNADGFFEKRAVRSVRMTCALRNAITFELAAQVRFLLTQGVAISHFDSHHHVHTIPALFGVLKKLQLEFGISRVRSSMNMYQNRQSKLGMLRKALWNFSLRHYQKTLTTELFTSLAIFYEQAGTLTRVPKTIELMTHPGATNCATETELLSRDWEDACPFQLALINYNQL
jgi:predicted glycoside hydrolase/deacetylase ChbG (UPF0249 family)